MTVPPATFPLPQTHSLPFSTSPPHTLVLSLLCPSPYCHTQLHTRSHVTSSALQILIGPFPLPPSQISNVAMCLMSLSSCHLYLICPCCFSCSGFTLILIRCLFITCLPASTHWICLSLWTAFLVLTLGCLYPVIISYFSFFFAIKLKSLNFISSVSCLNSCLC